MGRGVVERLELARLFNGSAEEIRDILQDLPNTTLEVILIAAEEVRCDRLWAEGKPHVYNPYEKESTKPRKKKLSKREWREMLDRRVPPSFAFNPPRRILSVLLPRLTLSPPCGLVNASLNSLAASTSSDTNRSSWWTVAPRPSGGREPAGGWRCTTLGLAAE